MLFRSKVPKEEGAPDGMCIDTEGNLWGAMWGGAKVVCYNPHTGEKLEEILVPTKYVTCVAFGGADLRTLYITTAQAEDGTGGDLYAIDVKQQGTLPFAYRGGKK